MAACMMRIIELSCLDFSPLWPQFGTWELLPGRLYYR